jgi:hypothetical protein
MCDYHGPAMPSPALSTRTTYVLYAAVVLVYVLSFPYHPALRSPNELCRLWQTRALVEYRTLEINRALRDYGRVGDLSVKDGKYYPSKAPLLSFAAVPIYAVLKAIGGGGRHAVPELPQVFWSRLFLTVLPTLWMLVYLRRLLLAYVAPATADLVVPTYALGSLALNYALAFMAHQATAVLVFAAFYALWRTERGEFGARGYVVAGAFAGASIACEYTAALPVVALCVYAAMAPLRVRAEPWSRRLARLGQAGSLAALGASPFLLGLCWYHQLAFGHPLVSGYKYLNDAAYQGWHVGGFLGIRLPSGEALLLSFFSPLRGLFTHAPWLLLSLPGMALLWRSAPGHSRSMFWLMLLQLVGYAYFTSSFAYHSWGWTAGPRHLTPWVPFLALPAALVLDRWLVTAQRPLLGGFGLGLCVLSIVLSGSLAVVNYIPPTLSTAIFGLVVPLMRDGYFSPSVLGFLGLANPASGALIWGLMLSAAALVGWRGLRMLSGQRGVAVAGSLAAIGLGVGLLALTTRGDARDLRAQHHLRRAWLAPPGSAPRFWADR